MQIEATLDPSSTKYPTRINCELLRIPRIAHKVKLVWLKAYEEYPPESHGALESFSQAKAAVAHLLRQETRTKRKSTTELQTLEKELDIHTFLMGGAPTQAALITRNTLLKKVKETKKTQKRSTYHAYKSSQYQERMTKEFFQGLKSPSTRNNIISLYITPDWDTPQNRDGSHTQDNQQMTTEVQKYYTHLFQAKPSINPDPLLNALNEGASIPDNLKSDLEAPITLKEINRAIDALATGKSPRSGWTPSRILQKF
jgi:hypothetical protein